MKSILPLLLVLLATLSSSGCGGTSTSAATEAGQDEHEHHHHHEEEHRPRDFPDAVGKAGLRHRGVLWELEHEHGDRQEFAHEFGEFLDVIDWLPEFAADSDMRKAEWDRVHAATARLRGAHAVVERKLAEGTTPTAGDVDVEAANAAFEELESVRAETRALFEKKKGDQL